MNKLCLFLLLFVQIVYSKQLRLDVFSKSAVLINEKTGKILFQKRAKELFYPASLTKVASLLYVLDKHPYMLNKHVKASKEALIKIRPEEKNKLLPAYWLETDGAHAYIKEGEVFDVNSLLQIMIVASANDAANVIAEAVFGSIPIFMSNLNKYLEEIGCRDTNFCNPHGLHNIDHITTANDLAIMARKAKNFNKFNEFVSKRSCTRPKTNYKNSQKLFQTNQLIKSKKKHYYSFATGVKTGFTKAAGYNLIAAAKNNNRSLIAVFLGGEKESYRYIDARRLFDLAFAEQKQEKTVITKEKFFQIQLKGANKPLKGILKNDLIINYYPSEEPNVKAFVHWNKGKFPIKKGCKVGVIKVRDEFSNILREEPIFAKEQVKKTFFYFIKTIFTKD